MQLLMANAFQSGLSTRASSCKRNGFMRKEGEDRKEQGSNHSIVSQKYFTQRLTADGSCNRSANMTELAGWTLIIIVDAAKLDLGACHAASAWSTPSRSTTRRLLNGNWLRDDG